MDAPTNIQIINGPDGAPAFVVIPYADYMAARSGATWYIPASVGEPEKFLTLGTRQRVHPCSRMRVGNYRVLFDADTMIKIIEIQQVKKRDGQTY